MKIILFLVITVCAVVKAKDKAIAVIHNNTIKGFVLFEPTLYGRVAVSINITGLTPGAHGFHIHQFGHLSKGCMSTGSHFNPNNYIHGAPTDWVRHVGDLGNIVADRYGNSVQRIVDSQIKLSGHNSIIGKAIVIHSKQDDLGRGIGYQKDESKKTGNAGSRVACAIIVPASKSSVDNPPGPISTPYTWWWPLPYRLFITRLSFF